MAATNAGADKVVDRKSEHSPQDTMDQRRLPTTGTDLSGEENSAQERMRRVSRVIAACAKWFIF